MEGILRVVEEGWLVVERWSDWGIGEGAVGRWRGVRRRWSWVGGRRGDARVGIGGLEEVRVPSGGGHRRTAAEGRRGGLGFRKRTVATVRRDGGRRPLSGPQGKKKTTRWSTTQWRRNGESLLVVYKNMKTQEVLSIS